MNDGAQADDPPDRGELARVIQELAAGNSAARAAASHGGGLVPTLAQLNALAEELEALRALKAKASARLSELTDVALAVASLDYSRKAEISGDVDAFDGLAAGMNMMIEELQSSTAFVNNILSAMPDALLVLHVDGSIKSANRAALELLGYAKGEILEQPVERVLREDAAPSMPSVPSMIERLRQTNRILNEEWALVTREGAVVPVALSASTLRDAQDELLGLVLVARDITEQKRAEEERERLQSAVRRQAQMLMELSTPLLPIRDGTVVLPLIGALDEDRAAQVTETLLRGITAHQARVAILDVTGVSGVDQQVASAILRAVRATRLIGAQVVLTGIRPDVARTMTALDIELGGVVVTCGTLKDGIAYAEGAGQRAARLEGRGGPRTAR
ncbi:PAS domain S-box protein [Sorangium sp. So ce260]|uniref:PAS domain S-box protein n=1 Tax=Sorangium sp. So ce260 TaxID=3133291 RepID=UPI003F62452B